LPDDEESELVTSESNSSTLFDNEEAQLDKMQIIKIKHFSKQKKALVHF